MTVIVAWKDKQGDLWMAGDRALCNPNNGSMESLGISKFTDAGGFLLGCSGKVAALNIVHSGNWPNPAHAPHAYGFVQSDLVPVLIERQERLRMPVVAGDEKSVDWIVAVRGQIYVVAGNGVICWDEDFAAIGMGRPEAAASLRTSAKTRWSMEKRIWVALKISEQMNDGVRGPFDILRLGDTGLPRLLQEPTY